jgi:hydrogenase expression/formation protein HypD
MRYVDEFRDPGLALRLLEKLRASATQPWVVMDVCGGQTHGLLRYGIEEALQGCVELVHGPGCPVCVTDASLIDRAQQLALLPDLILTSFGDMLRVPGTQESLLQIRARGGSVRSVYSPLDAVALARSHPDQQVVFFAVGFETTAPATALAVLQAEQLGLRNFSLLVAHVCVVPAMEAVMLAPDSRVQGFLAAGHVCTVTGTAAYSAFTERFRVPVAITGFEPLDLLQGILAVVEQCAAGQAGVVNCYARSVQSAGNAAAQATVEEVYERAPRRWRGMGELPASGLQLRPRFHQFDALHRFPPPDTLPANSATVAPLPALPKVHEAHAIHGLHVLLEPCRSGEVLSGRLKPTGCPHFGTVCTPEHPLGAPMVSSEGACAAYFRYRSAHFEARKS